MFVPDPELNRRDTESAKNRVLGRFIGVAWARTRWAASSPASAPARQPKRGCDANVAQSCWGTNASDIAKRLECACFSTALRETSSLTVFGKRR